MSVARELATFAVATLAATPVAAQTQAVPAFQPADGVAQCRGVQGYAQDFDGRRTSHWLAVWLESMAAKAQSDDAFRQTIIRDGEKALGVGPISVTAKTKLPPGATANDYASIGPYWWPDPKKKDGLPYIRKDGDVNPERDGPEFDRSRIRDLAGAMEDLSLAYYITGEERFADHAAMLARTFFVDPATRMNPNFNFAQGVPGKVDGRGYGIIEAMEFSTMVEAFGVMAPSAAFDDDLREGLRGWFRDFAIWLATSENGEEEMRATNNHGVFYDFFLSHFALYAGDPGVATNIVNAFPDYRIGQQMDKQGRFINELKRTRSWHYSHFVVEGAAKLATIGECVGLDLWTARTEDGRGLGDAWRFLQRYPANAQGWPFPDQDMAAGKTAKLEATRTEVALLFGRGSGTEVPAALP